MVYINDQPAPLGQQITDSDVVTLDGTVLKPPAQTVTIMLNKPTGYVCSRDGQGSQTIYELLPAAYQELKPVGRLDKDSSGLLLLTNDGTLAYQLTHPSFQKEKRYQVVLDHDLSATDLGVITTQGVKLEDGPSKLGLLGASTKWEVTMTEGRNRQVRRTFEALGYSVKSLHRQQFGEYNLGDLTSGTSKPV